MKKSKNDVTSIKQVPLHPWERMKRLEKTNQKVQFVKGVADVKPKTIVETKKKTDKIIKINRKKKLWMKIPWTWWEVNLILIQRK